MSETFDGESYFIDKTGKVAIAPGLYVFEFDFHDGLALISKEGKWGCIDKSGKEVIPCLYNEFSFSEDLACVEKEGKWGYIDKTGKEVIPFIYDYASAFSEGVAFVNKDGQLGVVDKEGNSTFDVDN